MAISPRIRRAKRVGGEPTCSKTSEWTQTVAWHSPMCRGRDRSHRARGGMFFWVTYLGQFPFRIGSRVGRCRGPRHCRDRHGDRVPHRVVDNHFQRGHLHVHRGQQGPAVAHSRHQRAWRQQHQDELAGARSVGIGHCHPAQEPTTSTAAFPATRPRAWTCISPSPDGIP